MLDAESLLAPLPRVRAVTISRVRWQPAASAQRGATGGLSLSCTLHWSRVLSQVRCFRVHCSLGPEKFLGLAFANQYRVVDLAVETAGRGQEGRVEFLVEPVPREGFVVPRADWGRAVLLFSLPE